jgi:hypothetical protein
VYLILAPVGGNGGRQINIGLDSMCACVRVCVCREVGNWLWKLIGKYLCKETRNIKVVTFEVLKAIKFATIHNVIILKT